MNRIKKWVGLSFALLAIISILAPFLRIDKAAALGGNYNSLPVIGEGSISELKALKPGDITLDFINRNQIRVTFPETLPYPTSQKTFNQLFGGIYEDVNSDSDWEYISKSSGTLDYLSDAVKINKSVEAPYHLGKATVSNINHLELSVGFRVELPSPIFYGIVFLNESLEWQTISNADVSILYNSLFDGETTPKIKPSNLSNFNLIGRYNVSAKTITSYESGDDIITFRLCGDNTFRLNCDVVGVDEDFLKLPPTGTLGELESSSTSVSMKFALSNKTVLIAGGANSSSDAINSGGTGNQSPGDGTSCEAAIDNGFGWAICPILDGADALINVTENTIQSKLEIDSEFTNNKGLRDAWTQLARIASGLLVIVALVMIISTALGFDVVSSYTLKKMLPRIVIGAIGIWLSWALATTYINFMNDLGRGIADIMYSPFRDALGEGKPFAEIDLKHIVTKSFANTGAGTDLAATGIFSVAIVSFLLSGGIFALLGVAVSLIAAMLIGLFLLTLREILIIFLLVLAPIGVAAWMLPNTQKTWKLWSGTFNKLLLMYPLFMGAFAAGKIFALISANATEDDNGVLEVIVPMLAYIAPFFFLPLLFKLAGSIFGNITGMVNDKGKGMFDKARGGLKTRGDTLSKSRKEAKDRQARINYANRNPTLRDRARLGFGRVRLRRGTKEAYGLDRERQAVQGHQESLEVQKLQGGVARHGARIQADRFSASAAIAQLDLAEAKQKTEAANAELSRGTVGGVPVGKITYTDSKGVLQTDVDFNYNEADHLEHIFNTSSSTAVQTAAFGQLVKKKSDKNMRRIVASRLTMPSEKNLIIQDAEADGSIAEAFFKKAPDIIMGKDPTSGVENAYKNVPAPQSTNEWSVETWELAIAAAHLRGPADVAGFREMLEGETTATGSLDSTKKAAIQTALGGPVIAFARPTIK